MANFLEQLAAEYYSHMGYFVRTNVKFGLRKGRGGYEGEIDVLAFRPETSTLLHIETSMDCDSWRERKNRFQKKFKTAESHYKKLFTFKIQKLIKIVIVGLGNPKKSVNFGPNIFIQSIPDFIKKITDYLIRYNPKNQAVPENFPLLRAMQFAVHFNR